MMSWEHQKRVILPYLQRAEEIEKVERKVAYYCRLYAVDQGIQIEERAPEADQLLGKVLSHLEGDKPYIDLEHQADAEYCEKFALGVFRNAERKDRAGQATRDTAKAYYAASIFLEIVKQFGELKEELEQYRRYAIFRATEIKKSLDKGEDGAPPPQPPKNDKVEKLEPIRQDSEAYRSLGAAPMDPGYQHGTKVFYSDDEMTVKAKGVVTGRLDEDGTVFAVKIPGHGAVQAKLEQLAPDLEEGASVLYAPEPGAPMVEATLIQVECANIWPPMYVVATRDGAQHACASRCLGLVHREVAADAMTDSAKQLQPTMGPASPRPTGWEDAHQAEDGRRTSPIDRRKSDGRQTTDAGPTTQPSNPDDAQPGPAAQAPTAAAGAAAGVHNALPPPTFPAPTQQPPAAAPATVAEAPAPAVRPRGQPAPQPAAPRVLVANNVPPEPAPGFVPGLQASEGAKKYAKFAASSLAFDDVEAAVDYLNKALRLLTQPEGQGK